MISQVLGHVFNPVRNGNNTILNQYKVSSFEDLACMVTCTCILKNHIHHDTWNIFFIGSQIEELEHSGLARQVSVLLTNHLARATECIGNEAAGTEALQDVLSLLNTLARSRMGRAILSQPACVSKLLSLLLDRSRRGWRCARGNVVRNLGPSDFGGGTSRKHGHRGIPPVQVLQWRTAERNGGPRNSSSHRNIPQLFHNGAQTRGQWSSTRVWVYLSREGPDSAKCARELVVCVLQ